MSVLNDVALSQDSEAATNREPHVQGNVSRESVWRRSAASYASYVQIAPAVILMTLFLIAPLVVMFGMSFFRATIFGIERTPSLANYQKFLSEPMYVLLLLKTVRIAVTSTIVIVLISFPTAYWLAKVVTRWKGAMLLLIFAPYWVNYVVRTYAWMPLLGRTGVINHLLISSGIIHDPISFILFNEFSVQLVMIYVFLPFGIIPLYLSLERLDMNLLHASADLGAPMWPTFRYIVLPLSMPGLVGASITVFVLSVGAYVTPRLVGGPSGILYGNIIADQFGGSFNLSWGATLSLIVAALTMMLIGLVARKVPLTEVFLRA